MMLKRDIVETFYDLTRPIAFELTSSNPEIAHKAFIIFCQLLSFSGLSDLLDETRRSTIPVISNAAGLNKNGDIPPTILNALGFDRVIVGTVTGDPWDGNSGRPRILRELRESQN